MRAKIMLLPGTKEDETLCTYAEHILLDVSAAFGHSFSLMREKIGELSMEAYGEALTEETAEACMACKAVLLCAEESVAQELYDALNLSLRVRSLCVPESVCRRNERAVSMYVGTVLSLDAETLRQAMRHAFRLTQEEDVRLVHVAPTGATKADWEAAVRVEEVATRSSALAMSAPDAAAAMITSPERMGLVLCPPYAGSILCAEGTALCSHPAMLHDFALGDGFAVYTPFLSPHGAPEMHVFSVAIAVSRMLKYSLGLNTEGGCVEAALCNVLANGWGGQGDGGASVSPEGILELICDQISVAGELMQKGGIRS